MGFNMKALQQMQNKMMKMQEDLQNSTFEGTSGGGAVTITMSGKLRLADIAELNPSRDIDQHTARAAARASPAGRNP